MSNRLRAEYEQTLTKPVFAVRYAFMTPAYVETFLNRFDAAAERITNPPTALDYPRDPNDEMLISLAVSVKADYLVTLDNDLLALPQYPDFANLPHQPKVLKPDAFLAVIEQRCHNPIA